MGTKIEKVHREAGMGPAPIASHLTLPLAFYATIVQHNEIKLSKSKMILCRKKCLCVSVIHVCMYINKYFSDRPVQIIQRQGKKGSPQLFQNYGTLRVGYALRQRKD